MIQINQIVKYRQNLIMNSFARSVPISHAILKHKVRAHATLHTDSL